MDHSYECNESSQLRGLFPKSSSLKIYQLQTPSTYQNRVELVYLQMYKFVFGHVCGRNLAIVICIYMRMSD